MTPQEHLQLVVTEGMLGAGRPGFPPGGMPIANNVWIVGDTESALIIDASHDAEAIVAAVGDRDPLGILLTHGHEDHVNAAVELADVLDTHLYLHPADLFLWDQMHPNRRPDFELAHGASFSVAGTELVTLHTPGHTPGSVCFLMSAERTLLSGDTLFHGGPGATRWEYSSFDEIIASIETQLFPLPGDTSVLPGHGASTTISAETLQLQAYKDRGW